MAGFFPHIGSITRDFASLPVIVGSILDTIVSDIGAGVNGWTVYDDQRNATGSYPIFYAFNNGIHYQGTTTRNNCWTFTSGSNQMWGNWGVGFGVPYALGYNTCPQDISIDGTNWYTAYYSAYPNQFITATLDRNFQQATTQTQYLQVRSKSYVVLECSSSIKTFYLLIAGMASPMLYYTQVYETWNSGTHVGTNGGQVEILRSYAENFGQAGSQQRAIFFFYPEAGAIFLGGLHPSGSVAQSLLYVGNLDTSGIRVNDTGALWACWSDNSYSGLAPRSSDTYGTANTPYGASQCLRTLRGDTWGNPTYHAVANQANIYQFVPRTRTYLNNVWNPSIDRFGKFIFCDADVWQAGYSTDGAVNWLMASQEGCRGTVRYLKVPVTNPQGLDFATFGPASDGNSYIMLRIIGGWVNPGAQQPAWGQTDQGPAYTSNGFSCGMVATNNYQDYIMYSTTGPTYSSMNFRWLMMPML